MYKTKAARGQILPSFFIWKGSGSMATIDQLTIDIDSSAKKAETTIDSLVGKLDILVKYLSKVTTTPVKINIDTSGFEKIEKAINISGIEKAAKSIQEKMSVATKDVKNFEEKYKDLGKGFTLKGSTEYIQKQIDNLTNQLAKAKLAKDDFEKSGKTDLAGYETAAKNVIKLTNQIESLKSQISDLQNIKPDMNFKINGLEESTKQISEVAEKLRTASIPESAFNYNADAMKAVFGEMASGIENWTQATQQFGSNAGAVLNQTSTETEELNAKTKKFEESLRSLKIPPINTDNLDALKRQLEKAEAKLDELRANLENGITMGRITENVGDSGYKKLREQIALTEKTAAALRDRIKEVGKESQNASGIKEVGKDANSAANSFSGLSKNSIKAANSLKKVQSSLKGVLKALLPILGIRQLINFGKDAVKSSMEYLETLNYFDAAFGQVAANADLSSFEEMGYNSAEAYYGSFAKRAEELTAKMSGFTIGKGGMLESTGAVSLGLDPSKLMNYQAMFGQMSSSMGVSSETALKLSQALTEIGADLASVKNLEFETVWNDMASGLAGMSRTLDKYGVNIRNVNLQQKLMELGIDANIQSLNQNDKALLRAIILLENTKYAWGDLADTINQPANQLRLIQANFQNLSRTIGNLFLPLVKTVLPYVNALVIAVQRLFSWLGNLMGIDMSGISTSIGGADMGNILDQTDDLSAGLGDAKKEADKLNKSLRQFDELKVISTKQDEGTAGGVGGISGGLLDTAFEDAFSQYQKVWDEAFGNLENRAQELADKIEEAFEPIKKIIQDFAVGDFFQAGKDVSALVVSITDFFAEAIDRVDWYGIGQKIGDFLAGIDWFAILKSVGNLIWQALKAAFELYVGAFSSAPLETALVSLVAFPKLLKAITSSKFITGIGKLWKNFKIWGEKIKLVTGTLTGNKDSVSDLVTAYPKLSKKIDAVKTAFSNFFFSVKNNGFWKTVDGGITNIRNNLGGLQKAAIVAVAGFAEFSVVSSTFEGLTLGTENVVAGLAKIGVAVAAAGAAMYVALGPAGLAIAAIVGVAGAIKGINDAFDTIRAQEIGESIKNAMSNPGGVPLSEVTAQFSDAIGKIGESFTVVTEKAAGLEQADSHIRDTWMEIEKIETSMDAGVISVEDGTAELTRLFGELAQTASDKFGQLETVLLAAFGENGVLTGVYERLGISTENTITRTIELHDKAKKRIEELSSALATMDPSNPNYATYKEELAALLSQTDELTEAVSKYEFALKQIDYSDLIGDKGEIDDKKLTQLLEDLKTAMENANKDMAAAVEGVRKTLNEDLNTALTLGDMKTAEEIQVQLNALPDALELLKGDVALKATELTDTIQIDFINGMNGVIEDAKTEWGEKGFWGQIWNGVFGAGTEGEFVKEAVDKQVENIEQLSSSIESALEDFKTDSPGWGKDAIGALYDSLFDTEYHFSDMGGGKTVYSLNEDFKNLINGATEGISELTKERGKDATDGYASSFSDETNIQNAQNEAKSFTEKVLETIAKTQDSNSPSKVTMGFGKDAVDGYTLGISSNTNLALETANSFTSKIIEKFSESVNPMMQIGANIMGGLSKGISSMESTVVGKVGKIANNVADSVKNALDIHSPSRVMFKLGDYTMQGFKNGMENLYQPILASVKDFSYDVAVAPAPSLTDMYSGYQYQTAYTPQYDISEYPQSGYNQSDLELKSLLRRNNELLSAILAKPTIEKGEIYSATKELYQRDSIRRYGNPSAYDPILGS